MDTKLLKINSDGYAYASEILKSGGLVAFPTETVYGLGANALNSDAVAEIYTAKKRPNFNPLIVHVLNLETAQKFAVFNKDTLLLANKFWPGPLTVVAPIKDKTNLSKLITAGLDTVAIRVPAHPVARKLLETFNGPIAAPSANPSGSISSTSAAHVKSGLGGRIQAILNGGKCDVGLESTIILSNNGQCNILRSGGISEKEIEEVLGYKISLNQNSDTPISPGQLSSHYAPNANLRMNVIKADEDEYMIGFGDVVGQLNLSSQGNLIEAATNLFAYLHMADEDAITLGKTKIAIAKIPMHGLGIAINDRLTRASTPKS